MPWLYRCWRRKLAPRKLALLMWPSTHSKRKSRRHAIIYLHCHDQCKVMSSRTICMRGYVSRGVRMAWTVGL